MLRIRSPRAICFLFLLIAACLFAANMYRSYSLGQFGSMYDNPIYRWRVSMAVALSQLHNPPLKGYVAYGSIANYLNHNGLALLPGEAEPLPKVSDVVALARDPARLERLLQQAAKVPVDPSLPNVPIIGSEKGEAAYYYWAFRLFGIHLTSLWYFYFVLLVVSVVIFAAAFWRSPFALSFLLLYLCAHLAMIGYATGGQIQTVHNSRFFPVLALLPALHILLLAIRRERLSWRSVAFAVPQCFLLFFAIFCRDVALWQPFAVVTATIVLAARSALWPARWAPARLRAAMPRFILLLWPAGLLLAGFAGFMAYKSVALDKQAYRTETTGHTLWDPILCGTVSSSPALYSLYGLGEEPFSDSMGYMIAIEYLRAHNIGNSPVVNMNDGVILLKTMSNMAAFDKIQRAAFFQIAWEHPWLVLRSFFYDKLVSQIGLLEDYVNQPDGPGAALNYWWLLLPVAAVFAAMLLCGVPKSPGRYRSTAALVIVSILPWSLVTTMVTPSATIVDTIALFVLLSMTIVVYVPALVLSVQPRFWRISVATARAHPRWVSLAGVVVAGAVASLVVFREPTIADLPPVDPFHFQWQAIKGIKLRQAGGQNVVQNQPVLLLTPVSSAPQHFLAGRFIRLENDGRYRVSVYLKRISGDANLRLNVVSKDGHPIADAVFDLTADEVIRSSGAIAAAGIERENNGWRRAWFDVAPEKGRINLGIVLIRGTHNLQKSDQSLEIGWGGLRIARTDAARAAK